MKKLKTNWEKAIMYNIEIEQNSIFQVLRVKNKDYLGKKDIRQNVKSFNKMLKYVWVLNLEKEVLSDWTKYSVLETTQR